MVRFQARKVSVPAITPDYFLRFEILVHPRVLIILAPAVLIVLALLSPPVIKRGNDDSARTVPAWFNPATKRWEAPAPWDPHFQALAPDIAQVPRAQVSASETRRN